MEAQDINKDIRKREEYYPFFEDEDPKLSVDLHIYRLLDAFNGIDEILKAIKYYTIED
jgi:hypothetical protein